MNGTMNSALTNEVVLERHIAWETYKTARLISERDFTLIKRFDKSTGTAQASMLEETTAGVFEALFTVLRNVTQTETVQYTLALLDEMLTAFPHKAAEMHATSAAHPGATTPNAPLALARLLSRADWFTQEKAAKLLSVALTTGPAREPAIVTQFLDWLTSQLRQPSAGEASVVAASGALAGLLRERAVRAEYAKGVPLLEVVLKNACQSVSGHRSQILYNLALCLWQLSFDKAAQPQLRDSSLVEVLVELLKEGNKEKVMRVALMTLTRLMECGGEPLHAQMVDCGLPRLVKIRSAQSWADEDIPELLEALDEALASRVAELSSYEKYRQEVLTGALEWTPMHTSAAFWQENIEAFEGKDFQVLRCLVKLLQTSRDAKVLAIACSDLGSFAEAHPHGRYIISDLGGKSLVMSHMANPNPEVQKHALLCTQRLMLGRDKLDFLKRPAGAGVGARAGPSQARA